MTSNRSAWIGAGAVIMGAVITGIFSLYHSAPKKINFSGEVRDYQGTPVKDARIISAEDQSTPESTYSDDNGIFHVLISNAAATLKITVTAHGYDPISRDVNPARTGPEEFILQPIVLPDGNSKTVLPSQNFTTKGKNSPIIVGHSNSVISGALDYERSN